MDEEERKKLKTSGMAKRVNIARQNDDEAVIDSTAYSKMVGGRYTHMECVMDSGCSFPLTTTAITKALGIEVMPLKQKLEMLDASNRIMEIIGTARIFIESDILGGRKCVEAAVVEGEKKETLISLQLLTRWDLIHYSFPFQTITEYCNDQKKNKHHKAYSTYYNFHSEMYEENRSIKPPSKKMHKLARKHYGFIFPCI